MKPELLMPAGSLQKLKYAYAYGADAVYLGVPLFSLRARENEFDLADLKEGINHAHSLGKKVYVTANIFSRNRKLKPFIPQLKEWMDLKPDAFIMSDPGLMMMAREAFPDINIHLSVQANCMNWQSVKFWHKSLGVSRVILSRELGINEIKEIKDRVPEIELEAFVHGSICIAYSGRCLLSSYMSHRDANQGVCDNSCREKFKLEEKKPEPKEYVLEDLRSPGEKYEIQEDEEGTYILNSKDLCGIEYIKELIDAGVCSLKIEGRTKSVNYVALVSRIYRKAIDDAVAGKPFDRSLMTELEKIAHRGYHPGFLMGTPKAEGQNYDTSNSRFFSQKFGGLVTGPMNADGLIPVEIRGTMKVGQACELQGPDMQTEQFQISKILDKKMKEVEAAHSGSGVFWIKGPQKSMENGIVSLVQ
ncbi:MAG: peptidase [Oligoflexia bacterium]|nr:MAG: peptidase [Oligoflexia bacterium]